MNQRTMRRRAGAGFLLVAAVAALVLPTGLAGAQPDVARLAGPDRFATAAAVSAATFDPGVDVAFVATGGNFPDALAGGPLAALREAPVLLTATDSLPEATALELDRLQPGRVVVLGGPPAVSDVVMEALADRTGAPVERLAGPDRFATAAAISAEGFAPGVADAYVATGMNFPDALAGGVAAGVARVPVLLTGADALPAATRSELERLRPARITVLGAAAVVGDAVVAELEGLTDGAVRRLAGADRFATASVIAADTFPAGAPVVFLATGANFPDALAGVPAAALAGGPLLLVHADCAPLETVDAVDRLEPSRIVVLGGEGVVADTAAALSPCGVSTAPPPTFDLDPSLEPAIPELPPGADGLARPVARVADDLGTALDFAESELLVMAAGAELDAFLARWGGTVMETIDPATYGFDDIEPVNLVRIDPTLADPGQLGADARSLDPMSQGTHGVSSEAGLGTIAASLHESADGMVVGLNALDEGTAIPQSTTTESSTAPAAGTVPAGLTWSSNAFNWEYMNGAHAQGIGIAEAWRLLDAAGQLGGSLPVGVVDDGFATTDNDRPANSVGLNAGFGAAGVFGCGLGNPCPWHGHWVSSALAAQVDNGIGAAGSGGPSSRLIMVQRGAGVAGTVQSILAAADEGARIINMSFGQQIPPSMASISNPLQRILDGLWLHHNRLFFASAGNANTNVDAAICNAGGCLETTLFSPCELNNVICVGGVAAGARTRHPNSNWGLSSVDIFAAFDVFVGGDPANPGNLAQVVSGTSFATPQTAGVAALLWEPLRARPPLFANPGNDEITQILMQTANPGGDAQVTRVLNAPAAVRRALGAGTTGAPTVQLVSPTGDITIPYGTNYVFEATASDAEDGANCCTLRWISDVDGQLSVARQFFYAFATPGVRTVTVAATDSSGTQSAPRTIRVDAVNDPPTVNFIRQTNSTTLVSGLRYPFLAEVSDPNEPDLGCDALTWVSSGDESPQSGCRPRIAFTPAGTRMMTLSARDALGATSAVTHNFTIIDLPPNSPPAVAIQEPIPGSRYQFGQEVLLQAEAVLEPGEVTPVTYRWLVSQGGTTTQVATTLNASWSCTTPNSDFGIYTYTITFQATDDDPGTGQDSVSIECERGLN